jgi:hypothetical protein
LVEHEPGTDDEIVALKSYTFPICLQGRAILGQRRVGRAVAASV